MKLQPLHDRIIVKRLDSDNRSKGGIYIPDVAQEKMNHGEVIAVGNGKQECSNALIMRIPMNVKVGDKILFGKYSGQSVEVDGDELLVMREEDVFAIVI